MSKRIKLEKTKKSSDKRHIHTFHNNAMHRYSQKSEAIHRFSDFYAVTFSGYFRGEGISVVVVLCLYFFISFICSFSWIFNRNVLSKEIGNCLHSLCKIHFLSFFLPRFKYIFKPTYMSKYFECVSIWVEKKSIGMANGTICIRTFLYISRFRGARIFFVRMSDGME